MLQGTQAEVYFNNFFTSVRFMKDLKLLNIQACGTVRANRRDLPAEAAPKKGRPALRRHETKVAQGDELVFAHWQDTKPVCILSSFHDPVATGTVRRRKDGERRNISVPACLADYQANMKDRFWKWWRRIFFHMLLVSVHNAYIVAKAADQAKSKRLWPEFQDYVEAVAHQLVTTTATCEAPLPDAPPSATLRHDVQKIFPKRKTCKTCSRKAVPGERRPTTQFGCVKCREGCHQKCLIEHVWYCNDVANNPHLATLNPSSDDDSDTGDERNG